MGTDTSCKTDQPISRPASDGREWRARFETRSAGEKENQQCGTRQTGTAQRCRETASVRHRSIIGQPDQQHPARPRQPVIRSGHPPVVGRSSAMRPPTASFPRTGYHQYTKANGGFALRIACEWTQTGKAGNNAITASRKAEEAPQRDGQKQRNDKIKLPLRPARLQLCSKGAFPAKVVK